MNHTHPNEDKKTKVSINPRTRLIVFFLSLSLQDASLHFRNLPTDKKKEGHAETDTDILALPR